MFQMRVLSGPLTGAVYRIRQQLEIGRTEASDIQLVGRGVSRQHAIVMPAEGGGHVLVDMLSTNGTWSGGQRVDRLELRDGVVFTIDDTDFVYERAASDPTFVPAAPYIDATRAERETTEFGGPRSTSAASETQTMRAKIPESTQARSSVSFVDPDGQAYPRNLLADIVVFRNLRLKMVRAGGKLDPQLVEQFRELDGHLRASPASRSSERREFIRFSCQLPGTLRLEKDDQSRLDVQVLDMAVDGARLRGDALAPPRNALSWLSLPLIGAQGLRCIVFTARVAWARDDECGLVFAGAPSWANRSSEHEQDETRPVILARPPLEKVTPEGG